MDTTENIKIGQVVKSKSGRDKGRIFIVNEILDEIYVTIVDGELRKISNPKKKKIKHLIVYNTIFGQYAEKVIRKEKINNAFVRKLIEPFNKKI